MPNNVQNELLIVSMDRNLVNEILDYIAYQRSEEDPVKTYLGEPFPEGRGTIDFNKIIPMPNHIYRGDFLPLDHNYGEDNWYDWSRNTWGAKWNAYDQGPYLGGNLVRFNTAWNPVFQVILALSKKFPNVEFDYKWADEDIGHNVGHMVIKNNKVLMEDTPKGGSREAYEMCFTIRNIDLDEYDYYLNPGTNNYEWRGHD